MKGSVIFQKRIYRKDLRQNPTRLYVFGDNMKKVGLGGQAGEMRGEPNAVGVPTKWKPSMDYLSFFSDDDLDLVKPQIDIAFHMMFKHIEKSESVVIPSDGLGTGLSMLQVHAPQILKYIESKIEDLVEFSSNE